MGDVEKAMATFDANIERQTGKSVAEWGKILRIEGLARHGQMVAWLKDAHGTSHSHANRIAKRALNPDPSSSDGDAVGHLFPGGKEALRPLYDMLAELVRSLGQDVSLAPKTANVSVRRGKQFALLQPSTRTRLDVGLILKGRAPTERLESSGSFNSMFTHRVRVERRDQVDAELKGWLKAAYDDAG
jgi:uncharacterized protein DUF5655/uncharacterized protein DUF4287